jgi:Raf kinase inhibitor-like YbhB/YbcL family protein
MPSLPRLVLIASFAVALLFFAACEDDGTDSEDPTPGEGATAEETAPPESSPPSGDSAALEISSSAFGDNDTIPTVYTCDGDNASPPLAFSDVPEDAQSLALIMDDPDAPSGTFVHWVVWNIDPATADVPANTVPASGTQGLNGIGQAAYIGPCPPDGEHHYYFKLYALDTRLDALDPSTADKTALEQAMEGHIIAQAELVGLYARP